MSVLLEYQSLQPVTSEVAEEIESEQRQFLKERCYWAEPLQVRLERAAPAKLVGDNSMFNSGGYTTQSGQWIEVSQTEDYLMAWSDTAFIAHKLAAWSKRHGVDWIVHSAGDHVGDVIKGEPSEALKNFLDGLLEASTLQPSMVSAIDQKFKNRCEPPEPSSLVPLSSNGSTDSSKKSKPWWRPW